MYFLEVLGFSRRSLQVPSAFIFTFVVPHLQGNVGSLNFTVTYETSGDYAYSGSTVYLNSDWAGIDVHFTIDWFV